MHPRYPGVRSSVTAVPVLRPNPGQVRGNDLVGVFLELASQLVAEGLPASLRLRPPDFRASLRPFCRIEPCLARVS
jgi:hypothetical protein